MRSPVNVDNMFSRSAMMPAGFRCARKRVLLVGGVVELVYVVVAVLIRHETGYEARNVGGV